MGRFRTEGDEHGPRAGDRQIGQRPALATGASWLGLGQAPLSFRKMLLSRTVPRCLLARARLCLSPAVVSAEHERFGWGGELSEDGRGDQAGTG
jgi:hypothetical protein